MSANPIGKAFTSRKNRQEGRSTVIGEGMLILWVEFLIEAIYFHFDDDDDSQGGPACQPDVPDHCDAQFVNYDASFGRCRLHIMYNTSRPRQIRWGIGGSDFR